MRKFAIIKKNLTVKDMKQIPRLKSDSIKPTDCNQQSSVLSSSGNVSVSRRHIDRSMHLREVHVCYYWRNLKWPSVEITTTNPSCWPDMLLNIFKNLLILWKFHKLIAITIILWQTKNNMIATFKASSEQSDLKVGTRELGRKHL